MNRPNSNKRMKNSHFISGIYSTNQKMLKNMPARKILRPKATSLSETIFLYLNSN
jgi:hypothetical protein